jgi:hypothetical protein
MELIGLRSGPPFIRSSSMDLNQVRVASPCSQSWAGMVGSERKRFCAKCRLNVYNLSEMTRADAEAFVARAEGRVCVRFFRRRDGTLMTRDCPVGLRALRHSAAWARARIGATLAFLMGAPVLQACNTRAPHVVAYDSRLREIQPFKYVLQRWDPEPAAVMGDIAVVE